VKNKKTNPRYAVISLWGQDAWICELFKFNQIQANGSTEPKQFQLKGVDVHIVHVSIRTRRCRHYDPRDILLSSWVHTIQKGSTEVPSRNGDSEANNIYDDTSTRRSRSFEHSDTNITTHTEQSDTRKFTQQNNLNIRNYTKRVYRGA